jgi:hypothetical protein
MESIGREDADDLALLHAKLVDEGMRQALGVPLELLASHDLARQTMDEGRLAVGHPIRVDPQEVEDGAFDRRHGSPRGLIHGHCWTHYARVQRQGHTLLAVASSTRCNRNPALFQQIRGIRLLLRNDHTRTTGLPSQVTDLRNNDHSKRPCLCKPALLCLGPFVLEARMGQTVLDSGPPRPQPWRPKVTRRRSRTASPPARPIGRRCSRPGTCASCSRRSTP